MDQTWLHFYLQNSEQLTYTGSSFSQDLTDPLILSPHYVKRKQAYGRTNVIKCKFCPQCGPKQQKQWHLHTDTIVFIQFLLWNHYKKLILSYFFDCALILVSHVWSRILRLHANVEVTGNHMTRQPLQSRTYTQVHDCSSQTPVCTLPQWMLLDFTASFSKNAKKRKAVTVLSHRNYNWPRRPGFLPSVTGSHTMSMNYHRLSSCPPLAQF